MDGKIMNTTSSTWRRMVAVGCLGAMSLGFSGCSVINGACRSVKQQECIDEFMIGYRNQALAAKAWHRVKNCYKNKTYYNDFKAGFFDGYADVAAGGPGCIPAVAPTTYWGWRYQSRDGQAAVNAYFEGYPLGVKAAEQDGVGHWANIRPNVSRPQQPQPFVAAPLAGYHDSDSDEEADNPFYPQPVPQPEPRDEIEEQPEDAGEEMDLGDDPAGAIERALEDALEGDDSVQYQNSSGFPFGDDGMSIGDDLVPRGSAEYEIADRRGGVADTASDEATLIQNVFGSQINAPQPATDSVEAGSDELPFVFE
tara:strand:+ start:278263 stop:279192 length:930 start_codon:yes stop_codon:yes gene_type:complete